MKTISALFTIATVLIHECEAKGVAIYAGAGNSRHRSTFQPVGPSDPNNYRMSFNVHESSYGMQFGEKGLFPNTHIFTDNYKVYNGYGKYLVEHLFKRESFAKSKLGDWTDSDDGRWRFTTKAPYFKNKIPRKSGKQNAILPAAAVVGAATAFGLHSLLPLNVEKNSPLLYCPEGDLAQDSIQLNGRIYSCYDSSFKISCVEEDASSNPSNSTDNSVAACINVTAVCGDNLFKFEDENLKCEFRMLTSRSSIVCDSFELAEDTRRTLQCYYGELPSKFASFIPTTESTTAEVQDESFYEEAKSFFSNIWRKCFGESEEEITTDSADGWVPEAIVMEFGK